VAKEWDDQYNGWKLTTFKNLETRDMDDYAQSEFKKLVKMARELRVIFLNKYLEKKNIKMKMKK
jgi:hypothetical protein